MNNCIVTIIKEKTMMLMTHKQVRHWEKVIHSENGEKFGIVEES